MAQIVIGNPYEAIARSYWQMPSLLQMSLSGHPCPLSGGFIANYGSWGS